MDLYDIWLHLNQTVNRHIKISAHFLGPTTIGVYVDGKIYSYVVSFDGLRKKITFIDVANKSFEDDGRYVVEKIKLTFPTSSL